MHAYLSECLEDVLVATHTGCKDPLIMEMSMKLDMCHTAATSTLDIIIKNKLVHTLTVLSSEHVTAIAKL